MDVGRHHGWLMVFAWAREVLFSEVRTGSTIRQVDRDTIVVVMAGPWMLRSDIRTRNRPRFDHMEVIMVGPWLLVLRTES